MAVPQAGAAMPVSSHRFTPYNILPILILLFHSLVLTSCVLRWDNKVFNVKQKYDTYVGRISRDKR